MTTTNCIEAWTQHMRGFVGLDAEHEPAAFGQLCAPDGPESARAFLCRANVPGGTNSSCALVAVGGLEAFIAPHRNVPELVGPLGFDRWDRACTLARRYGALVEHCDGSWTAELGDIVHVARVDGQGHAALHWFTLVENLGKMGWKSVDGGQVNEHGYQAVRECQRAFIANGHAVMELQSWKYVAACIRVRALLEGLGL